MIDASPIAVFEYGTLVRSFWLNWVVDNLPKAVDGTGGGLYQPTNPIVIGAGGVIIEAGSELLVEGGADLLVEGTMTVDGTSVYNSDVDINGALDVLTTLAVGGLATFNGGLTVPSGDTLTVASGGFQSVAGTWNLEDLAFANVKNGANLVVKSGGDIEVESGGDINIQGGGAVRVAAGGSIVTSGASSIQVGNGGNLLVGSGGSLDSDSLITASAGIMAGNGAGLTAIQATGGDGASAVVGVGGSGGGTGGTFTGAGGGHGCTGTGQGAGSGVVATGGGSGDGLYASGSLTAINCGTGNMRFTGTDPVKTADPGFNNYACGALVCKAWGSYENFSGSNDTTRLLDAINVASVATSGINVTVTFARAMASANYSVRCQIWQGSGGLGVVQHVEPHTKTTAGFVVQAFTLDAPLGGGTCVKTSHNWTTDDAFDFQVMARQ